MSSSIGFENRGSIGVLDRLKLQSVNKRDGMLLSPPLFMLDLDQKLLLRYLFLDRIHDTVAARISDG